MTAVSRRRRKGRVLFLSHAAERTGPPIILLHLARWLRAHTDLDFGIVFLQGGELEEEFRSLAPVWILDEWDPPRPAVVLDSLAWKFGLERHAPRIRAAALRWRMRGVRDFDVVYVNTCGSVRPLRYLPLEDPIVLTHVHELSVGLDFHLPPEDRELIREVTRHYITVSDAVSEDTERVFGATPDQITRQYGFVELPPEDVPLAETAALRSSLGIPDDAPIVGAAGLTHWRKAPDLFVQVARLMGDRHPGPAPHFVWVGGEAGGPELEPVRYDVEHAGLADRMHFLGHQSDPLPWFRLFDVLLLPAREDAFPLVCLEAASLGVPIICFDNGGMPEFVGDGERGFVVPYPDLAAMAERTLEVLGDDELRDRLGDAARAKARSENGVETGAAAIHRELERWI
ncbi:MAG: glycosyltransferase family 4 protein [Acidimicrobiales bacterium]|nr:glycosyltransferase family 4 protein [Acidimicrobiales bacterium]